MTTRRYDLLAMGRSLLDLYAAQTGVPFVDVESFAAYVGGCPANISVGARRLGLRTALLTSVGDDAVGDFVMEFLRREDVDVSFAPRKIGRRTSAVLVAVPAPDRPSLVAYRDNCADLELTADDVTAAPVETSRALLVTGTGLSREPSRSATMTAAERGRAAGTRVVLDLDYRPEYWPDPRAFGHAVHATLPFVHVAIGTADEVRAAMPGARAVAHAHDSRAEERGLEEGAEVCLAAGVDALVVKRGPQSTFVFPRGGGRIEAAPFRIDVCNPLGAGDAFAAGLVYALLEGWPWARAARMGNACGAIVASRHGCANFMPRMAEVLEFVARQGGF